jgi:hypothetical protein
MDCFDPRMSKAGLTRPATCSLQQLRKISLGDD